MNPKNLKTNYRHKTKTSIHHWSLQPTKGSSEPRRKKTPQNPKPKTKKNRTKKQNPKGKNWSSSSSPKTATSQPEQEQKQEDSKTKENPQMWERLIDRCRPNTQKLYFRRNKPTRIQKYPNTKTKKHQNGRRRKRKRRDRERKETKEGSSRTCLRGGRAGGRGRTAVLRSLFDSLWRPGDKPAGR
jgi:hypothetical protein